MSDGIGALFALDGKVALVTGAAGGLGSRMAVTLARAGAKVALAGRRSEALAKLAEEIAAFDGRALPVELDLPDPESVARCIETSETELGPLCILINNAGIVDREPSLTLSQELWDQVIDVNLKGAFLMAQAAARRMIDEGHGGSIVNIASILGLVGAGRVSTYSATKGGLISLTRTLAVEWARHGIRVNAICPGYIETDLNREFLASKAGDAIKTRIPQRRTGTPADLDGALMLLASDAGTHITGSALVVDGGLSVAL
ncbi:MAG: SDR family NAD(P)-dependent oxidoreductase [Kiloniellales bacterium]